MDGVVEGDHFPIGHRNWGLSSMNDMLWSIYSDPEPFTFDNSGFPADANRNNKAEEVWWDIPSDGEESPTTLEDFLENAAAFGTETAITSPAYTGIPIASNVCEDDGMAASACDYIRGKRSWAAVEDLPAPLDKATRRKQRRMVKNRESAARSRERKQAYTMGLESLVTQLEKDNARLLKEEAESDKERYKQLMENLIPVIESRKPSRFTRVHSMEW